MEKKIDKEKIQKSVSDYNELIVERNRKKFHLHFIIILLVFLFLLYKRPELFTSILSKINPNLVSDTLTKKKKDEIAEITDKIPENIWVGDEIKFGDIDFIVYDIKPSYGRKSAFLVTKNPISSSINTFAKDYFSDKDYKSFERVTPESEDKVIFFTKEMEEEYKDVFKGNPLNLTGDNKHFAIRVRYNGK